MPFKSFLIFLLIFTFSGFIQAEAIIDKAAPGFDLPDQEGKAVSLAKLKGKWVVLEWTNPDCPFVVKHYNWKTMTKTLQSFKSKKIEWLAINSSHFSNIKKNKEWHSARKLPYKVLDDHKGLVGRKYSAKTTPQMFIINPKGVLVYKGAIDSDPRMGKGKKVNYVLKALKNVFAAKKIDPTKTKPYGCSVKYK